MGDDGLEVEILRCPAHAFWAVAIGGTRITPSKCCGRWEVVRSFPVGARSREDLERVLSARGQETAAPSGSKEMPDSAWFEYERLKLALIEAAIEQGETIPVRDARRRAGSATSDAESALDAFVLPFLPPADDGLLHDSPQKDIGRGRPARTVRNQGGEAP